VLVEVAVLFGGAAEEVDLVALKEGRSENESLLVVVPELGVGQRALGHWGIVSLSGTRSVS
jgi:hypothetical protein